MCSSLTTWTWEVKTPNILEMRDILRRIADSEVELSIDSSHWNWPSFNQIISYTFTLKAYSEADVKHFASEFGESLGFSDSDSGDIEQFKKGTLLLSPYTKIPNGGPLIRQIIFDSMQNMDIWTRDFSEDTPLAALDLDKELYNHLYRMGVRTLEDCNDLVDLTEALELVSEVRPERISLANEVKAILLEKNLRKSVFEN